MSRLLFEAGNGQGIPADALPHLTSGDWAQPEPAPLPHSGQNPAIITPEKPRREDPLAGELLK